MAKTPDYYQILGVDRKATEADIRRTYKIRVFKDHPDRNPNDETATGRIKKLNHAFAVLSDPEKRYLYDKFGTENPDAWSRQTSAPFNDVDGYESSKRSRMAARIAELIRKIRESEAENLGRLGVIAKDVRLPEELRTQAGMGLVNYYAKTGNYWNLIKIASTTPIFHDGINPDMVNLYTLTVQNAAASAVRDFISETQNNDFLDDIARMFGAPAEFRELATEKLAEPLINTDLLKNGEDRKLLEIIENIGCDALLGKYPKNSRIKLGKILVDWYAEGEFYEDIMKMLEGKYSGLTQQAVYPKELVEYAKEVISDALDKELKIDANGCSDFGFNFSSPEEVKYHTIATHNLLHDEARSYYGIKYIDQILDGKGLGVPLSVISDLKHSTKDTADYFAVKILTELLEAELRTPIVDRLRRHCKLKRLKKFNPDSYGKWKPQLEFGVWIAQFGFKGLFTQDGEPVAFKTWCHQWMETEQRKQPEVLRDVGFTFRMKVLFSRKGTGMDTLDTEMKSKFDDVRKRTREILGSRTGQNRMAIRTL